VHSIAFVASRSPLAEYQHGVGRSNLRRAVTAVPGAPTKLSIGLEADHWIPAKSDWA